MWSRVLCALVCLVAFPAFAVEITVDGPLTIGPADPVASYRVREQGHLTVLEGATIDELTIFGGSLSAFGGSFQGDAFIDTSRHVEISGGTFQVFQVVNRPMVLDVSGGVFERGLRFDDSGWGGGVVTVTGGENLSLGFGGLGNITWTAHVHGGQVNNAAGIAGNSIHVYGHWLTNTATRELDDGRMFDVYRTQGVLEDGTPFSWFARSDFNPDYPDPANIYTLHDLGPLPGDTNNDQRIDIGDLNNVRNAFGGGTEGDADFDGDTDVADLNLVRNRFGLAAASSIAAVPEPASWLLLGIVMLAGSRCRRHW